MIADHPTDNTETDLAMPLEPVAPALAAGAAPDAPSLPSDETGELGASDAGDGIADAGELSASEEQVVEEQDDAAEVVAGGDDRKATEDDGEPAEEADQAEEPAADEAPQKDWYILKVQVNREDSIRDALIRRVKIEGLEQCFGEIIVPTEEVAEFNKSGKRRIVRRKLYPGYLLVHMAINDDTWFLVRETPGVGDFTGSAGKPTPMEARDVERILRLGVTREEGGGQIKTAIPFKTGDRVRVKDGHFQNFEGEVDAIDEANGRITVMINIFNRSTPVELEHWQVESV